MRPVFLAAVLAAFLAGPARPAAAAWPHSPLANLPVSTAAGLQTYPQSVPDGAGGAIVVWTDDRTGAGQDIYAQHVLASGLVDPAWPVNGLAVCAETNIQYAPDVVSDGAGGAIVVWQDLRTGTSFDLYAQHVLASGAVDPAWPAGGLLVCGLATSQYAPRITTDGAGGGIVTWFEGRGATSNDLYAMRVLVSGALDPAWPANGAVVSAAAGTQSYPLITSDGAGGAIVAWRDGRTGNFDIYAMRMLATGVAAPGWPADGRLLCGAAGTQDAPQVVSDGAGGAIVAWRDMRSGAGYDLYAQHVFASGVVDAAWPVDGRAICTASFDQYGVQLATDGAGGAIVAWQDLRSGNQDLYAQHVLSYGQVDPGWPADGRSVCAAAGSQDFVRIAPDGAGGAILVWQDYRNGAHFDLYAHHVTAAGAADPAWPADGRAVCLASGSQDNASLVPDGAGGAILVWQDGRGAAPTDIYAQRVAPFGQLGSPEPAIAGVADVPGDQGGRVKLSWDASWLDLEPSPIVNAYDVLRSVPPQVASLRIARGARVFAPGASPATPAPGDLVAVGGAEATVYWEFVTAVTALHYVSGYSLVAATTSDSTAAGNPPTLFLVVAHDGTRAKYWPSAPAAGYSVDDLAPAAPSPFAGEYAGGATSLSWGAGAEADLAGYRLYRGSTASFVPGPENRIASLADTAFVDAPGAPAYYKLTAVDVHGNESAPAALSPAGTLDAADPAVPALALGAPSPNPAHALARLRFDLPRSGPVRLALFDLSGRLVRELVDGVLPAGGHAAAWDLRDAAGGAVRPGLYFARLEAGGATRVRTVVVAR